MSVVGSRRGGSRRGRSRGGRVAAVSQAICGIGAMLCLTGCGAAGVRSATHGALDEVRRSEPALLDPDTLHDTTAALMSGLQITPEFQADASRLANQVVLGALAPVAATTHAILVQFREQLLALVASLDSPLGRLTHAQLEELRLQIRGSIRDVDVGLQLLIEHNTSRLAEQLRTTIGPALNEGVLSALETGSDQIGYRMADGIGRGLRQQVQPAVQDVGLNLLGRAGGSSGSSAVPSWLEYGITAGALALIGYLVRERMRLNDLLARTHPRAMGPQSHGKEGEAP